ncbi:MAG: hypothetical protein HQL38_05605 [Alphaproteobacteria bacterium]|nr:hypothetical protein [Alphaproteobacteria bacterium]
MPLFRRDKLQEPAQRVLDSFKMTNTSPEFDDAEAVRYMKANRSFFMKDMDDLVDRLDLDGIREALK